MPDRSTVMIRSPPSGRSDQTRHFLAGDVGPSGPGKLIVKITALRHVRAPFCFQSNHVFRKPVKRSAVSKHELATYLSTVRQYETEQPKFLYARGCLKNNGPVFCTSSYRRVPSSGMSDSGVNARGSTRSTSDVFSALRYPALENS